MLCLTGNENNNRELLERLQRKIECPVPLVYEVRADLLCEPVDYSGIFNSGRQIVFTCRRAQEGGAYAGSENERIDLLNKAVNHNAWAVDIEIETAAQIRDPLIENAKAHRVKVILSKHYTRRCSDLYTEVKHLRSIEADYWKLVAPIDDSAELSEWLEIENDERLILIASGAAGQISRFWYKRFGSPFTYISMDEISSTSEYQPTLADACNGRISYDNDSAAFLILGGTQIIHSRGPHVFNRLFAKKAFNGVYCLAIGDEPLGLLSLAEKLEVKGASVTKPLKEKIIPLLQFIDERAKAVGAVNTLRFDTDGWHGTNTDVCGFEGALNQLYGSELPKGAKALLLGAGGAARAVAYGLIKNGFCVTICNRTYERAARLAAEFNMETCPWDARDKAEFDLLVNSTSIGMDDLQNTPYPYVEKIKDRMLLDIISHPVETRLVLEARSSGAKAAIGGMSMWLYQAAAQLEFWLGWKNDIGELEEVA